MVLQAQLVFLDVLQQLDARQNIAKNATLMIQQNATHVQPMLLLDQMMVVEMRYEVGLL
jgi:hypothetical protein